MPERDRDNCVKCGTRCRAGTGSSGPGTAIFPNVITVSVSERQAATLTVMTFDTYEICRVCPTCAPVMKDALMELFGFEFTPYLVGDIGVVLEENR